MTYYDGAAYQAPAAPANRRRRRSHRGWLIFGIVLLVLALLVVAADRISHAYAQSAASKYLALNAPFDRTPSVSIDGFPFLTQVIEGKYTEIDVRGSGLRLGDITGASLDAHLHGVHLPAGDLYHRDVTSLPIDEVDGSITVPFAELARLSTVPNLSLSDDGGALRVSVGISVFGDTVSVSGTATAQVSGGAIKIIPGSLSAAGVTVPAAVLSPVLSAISVPIELPTLPYGLKIDAVAATTSGVAVHGSADDVVISSQG